MRIQPLVCLIAALAFAGIFGPAAPSMAGPAQEQARAQIDVNVLQVPLMVSVTDNKGKLITNLTKEDFKIYEDDKLQTIRSFNRDADLPLSIALLVDQSGSIIEHVKFEQAAATDFFFNTIKRRKDRATVIGFDSTVNLLSDETEDGFSDEPERLPRLCARSRPEAGPRSSMRSTWRCKRNSLRRRATVEGSSS